MKDHKTQVMKRLLKNMAMYAEANHAEYNTEALNKDGGGNPGSFVNAYFHEAGCVLEFTVDWMNQTVYIEDFSEDPTMDGSTMSFDEFFKFQCGFENTDTCSKCGAKCPPLPSWNIGGQFVCLECDDTSCDP